MCSPVRVKYRARKLLVLGKSPSSNLWLYSKYLTTRKTPPSRIVPPMYRRNVVRRPRISDAHAITIVIEEVIRTMVLNVAIGTFRIVAPRGQLGAPDRI